MSIDINYTVQVVYYLGEQDLVLPTAWTDYEAETPPDNLLSKDIAEKIIKLECIEPNGVVTWQKSFVDLNFGAFNALKKLENNKIYLVVSSELNYTLYDGPETGLKTSSLVNRTVWRTLYKSGDDQDKTINETNFNKPQVPEDVYDRFTRVERQSAGGSFKSWQRSFVDLGYGIFNGVKDFVDGGVHLVISKPDQLPYNLGVDFEESKYALETPAQTSYTSYMDEPVNLPALSIVDQNGKRLHTHAKDPLGRVWRKVKPGGHTESPEAEYKSSYKYEDWRAHWSLDPFIDPSQVDDWSADIEYYPVQDPVRDVKLATHDYDETTYGILTIPGNYTVTYTYTPDDGGDPQSITFSITRTAIQATVTTPPDATSELGSFAVTDTPYFTITQINRPDMTPEQETLFEYTEAKYNQKEVFRTKSSSAKGLEILFGYHWYSESARDLYPIVRETSTRFESSFSWIETTSSTARRNFWNAGEVVTSTHELTVRMDISAAFNDPLRYSGDREIYADDPEEIYPIYWRDIDNYTQPRRVTEIVVEMSRKVTIGNTWDKFVNPYYNYSFTQANGHTFKQWKDTPNNNAWGVIPSMPIFGFGNMSDPEFGSRRNYFWANWGYPAAVSNGFLDWVPTVSEYLALDNPYPDWRTQLGMPDWGEDYYPYRDYYPHTYSNTTDYGEQEDALGMNVIRDVSIQVPTGVNMTRREDPIEFTKHWYYYERLQNYSENDDPAYDYWVREMRAQKEYYVGGKWMIFKRAANEPPAGVFWWSDLWFENTGKTADDMILTVNYNAAAIGEMQAEDAKKWTGSLIEGEVIFEQETVVSTYKFDMYQKIGSGAKYLENGNTTITTNYQTGSVVEDHGYVLIQPDDGSTATVTTRWVKFKNGAQQTTDTEPVGVDDNTLAHDETDISWEIHYTVTHDGDEKTYIRKIKLIHDVDNDGIPDSDDLDIDGDGTDNVDDTDDDGDGVLDVADADHPDNKGKSDQDGDGVIDEYDDDIDGDGVPNAEDTDKNNDGQDDTGELPPGTPDLDGDGIADYEDDDIDGDGILNVDDLDDDNDDIPDVVDADSNDGFDLDNDGILDFGDASQTDGKNSDTDDVLDLYDLDDDNDGELDTEDKDDDGDGIRDYKDTDHPDNQDKSDMDGDGIIDEYDDDVDGDGTPNTQDVDTDNDGVNDDVDVFDTDPTEWADTDGDGVGDNSDLYPNDPTRAFGFNVDIYDSTTELGELENVQLGTIVMTRDTQSLLVYDDSSGVASWAEFGRDP